MSYTPTTWTTGDTITATKLNKIEQGIANAGGALICNSSYDDDANKPLIYIGEAENIIARLKQHIDKKDNWNEVIVFISKDSNLNKAHIEYLSHSFAME